MKVEKYTCPDCDHAKGYIKLCDACNERMRLHLKGGDSMGRWIGFGTGILMMLAAVVLVVWNILD